jgi:hypothetical protein
MSWSDDAVLSTRIFSSVMSLRMSSTFELTSAMLLSAAPRPLTPGAEAEVADEIARVTDLAFAVLVDAHSRAASAARAPMVIALLHRAVAAVPPLRRQRARRLVRGFLQPLVVSALYVLPFAYLTPTAAEFRALAAAGGEMPVRFWLPSRGQSVVSLFRPSYTAALAVCLAPEAFVAWFLANSDAVEAVSVTMFSAALLTLHSDAYLLPESSAPGNPPVVWSSTASVVQVMLTIGTVVRTYGWTPRLAAFLLISRACLLTFLVGGTNMRRVVPVTRINHITLPMQVVALLLIALWREWRGRIAARRAVAAAAAVGK